MLPEGVGDHMRAYYDRRAPEYDEWWLGEGPFARRERPGWFDERDQLIEMVRGLPGAGGVLDVACGTGYLTRHLAGPVVCLDQSPAMLRIASSRVPRGELVRGSAAPLPFRDQAFGTVFTSHFYGHLLPGERAGFLDESRRVGERLVVVDAARQDGVEPEQWQDRGLNDGSRHQIYKRYFTGAGLARELGGGEVLHEGRWFVVVVTAPR